MARQCGLGSLLATAPSKKATWRTAVRSGLRRHWLRSGHAPQVAAVPLNTIALRPLMMALALLSLSVLLAGHTQVPCSRSKVKSLGKKVFALLGRLCAII